MQRYFVKNNQILMNSVLIGGQDFHHIRNVMRMNIGDKVIIVDENENAYISKIVIFNENNVELSLLEKLNNNVELPIKVTIAFGLTKRDKTEEVLRRICELGADEFVNVEMKRSIVRLKDFKSSKMERMSLISKEACEQSHRNRVLRVHNPISFNEFLKYSCQFDLCLYAYEESGRNNNYDFKDILKNFNFQKLLVLVGPEGGFDLEEVKLLNQNKFISIGLGPRILRCETAPLYIMSAISYEMELKNEG